MTGTAYAICKVRLPPEISAQNARSLKSMRQPKFVSYDGCTIDEGNLPATTFKKSTANIARRGVPNLFETCEKYLGNGKPLSLAIRHASLEPAVFVWTIMRYCVAFVSNCMFVIDTTLTHVEAHIDDRAECSTSDHGSGGVDEPGEVWQGCLHLALPVACSETHDNGTCKGDDSADDHRPDHNSLYHSQRGSRQDMFNLPVRLWQDSSFPPQDALCYQCHRGRTSAHTSP